jgi:hypothetical protein
MLDVRRLRVLREVALRGSIAGAAESLRFTTINSIAMTPAGSQVTMRVHNSVGGIVGNAITATTSPATLTMNNLPAGTYKIFVQPIYSATGSFQLSRP